MLGSNDYVGCAPVVSAIDPKERRNARGKWARMDRLRGLVYATGGRAWARSSVVEHTLHTGGVAGSIPAAPTMPFNDLGLTWR